MVCLGSLSQRPLPFPPCFVNNDYIISKITYSTEHAHHKVLTWSGVTLCCRDMWAPPRNWQHYCCVTDVSVGSATRGGNTGVCCYSCCTSQERINMSAVPMAPWVFFQPLGSRLPTLGSVISVNSKTIGATNRTSNNITPWQLGTHTHHLKPYCISKSRQTRSHFDLIQPSYIQPKSP